MNIAQHRAVLSAKLKGNNMSIAQRCGVLGSSLKGTNMNVAQRVPVRKASNSIGSLSPLLGTHSSFVKNVFGSHKTTFGYSISTNSMQQRRSLFNPKTVRARHPTWSDIPPPAGHKFWGLIIYRCTYDDDALWTKFMAALHQTVRMGLEDYDALELTKRLRLDVCEDVKMLDGASKELVRKHFRAWVESSAAEEELYGDCADGPRHMTLRDGFGTTPGYFYCIHVDQDALYSFVQRGYIGTKAGGYVNLIDGFWEMPTHPEEVACLREEMSPDDPADLRYEPIEDCTMENVGWMKVRINKHLMPYGYSQLLGSEAYDRYYERPPEVVDFGDFKGELMGQYDRGLAPPSGCWRRAIHATTPARSRTSAPSPQFSSEVPSRSFPASRHQAASSNKEAALGRRTFHSLSATRDSHTAVTEEIDDDVRSIAGLGKGHKYWGFIIYRCTYGDDAAWSAFMDFIRAETRRGLEWWLAPELENLLKLDVRDDADLFDKASKNKVRQHFQEWISSSSTAEAELDGQPDDEPILIQGHGTTARYQYCIHMDDDALYSIIDRESKEPKPMAEWCGFLNIINANWRVPDEEDQAYLREMYDKDDALDEGEEPVDGCRMYNVGWVKVRPACLLPGTYSEMMDWETRDYYVRPPAVQEWPLGMGAALSSL